MKENSLKKLKNTLFFLLKKNIVLYFLIYFIVSSLININKMQPKALNALKPILFTYLAEYSVTHEGFDKKQFKDYLRYFKKIVKYMPRKADAHGMLGYCQYYLGDKKKAVQAYQQASKINSRYFWFHFNLGVIYYEMNDYKKSIISFKKALLTGTGNSETFIKTSKIFQAILLDSNFQDTPVERLKKAYYDCYKVLILSSQHLQKNKDAFLYAKSAIETGLDDDGFFYYQAGVSLFDLKEYKKSIGFFQGSIGKNRNNPQAFYYLGLSLKKVGNDKMSHLALKEAALLKKQDREFISEIINQKVYVQIF